MYSYQRLANGLSVPDGDKGFYFLQKGLLNISDNPQILIFVTGSLTTFFTLYGLKKYSSFYELTIFTYLASGYYIVTMNGIRQTLVSGLFYFFSMKYLQERKFFEYSISIILISTFHSSALILIPLYFLFIEENWSYKIAFLVIISIVLVLFYNSFIGIGENVIGKYGHYIRNEMNYQGANFIRVLIEGIPLLLCWLNKKKIKKKWKDGQIFINISLLNIIFMSLATQNWIFARFSLYLVPSNFIILPYVIKNILKSNDKKIIYVLCVLFYLLYFIYENSIVLGINYRSILLGVY